MKCIIFDKEVNVIFMTEYCLNKTMELTHTNLDGNIYQ